MVPRWAHFNNIPFWVKTAVATFANFLIFFIPTSGHTAVTVTFFKNWPSRLLFDYFRSFQTNNTMFTTNQCEKCPSRIWRWDLNPRPLESSPKTTKPGLPPLVPQTLWILNFFANPRLIFLFNTIPIQSIMNLNLMMIVFKPTICVVVSNRSTHEPQPLPKALNSFERCWIKIGVENQSFEDLMMMLCGKQKLSTQSILSHDHDHEMVTWIYTK